jgi:ATP-dependent helicase/nuclease subunit A
MWPSAAQGTAGVTLTNEQRRAIDQRKVSVALSAGAGCGKTRVLTERFLWELDPQCPDDRGPAQLNQLVAITFTERAAREMRERIRSHCHHRVLQCDATEAPHWLALLRQLDTARISTIHSYCASLLRSHAVQSGVDPQFEVLVEYESQTLLSAIRQEYLREILASGQPQVIELAARYGLESLGEMLCDFVAVRQKLDWQRWLSQTPDQLLKHWERYWQQVYLRSKLQEIAESEPAQRLLEIIAQCFPPSAAMQQRFAVVARLLPNLPHSKTPLKDLEEIKEAAKVQGGGSKAAWASDETYEQFKEAAAQLRDMIDPVRKSEFKPEAARPAAEAALAVLRLAYGLHQRYEQQKQELGVLDFDDLLIKARDLFAGRKGAQLRREMSKQLRLLLVDEFQDTDGLQVELIRSLCDEGLQDGKLFFVGDYKQSIYRFRGAEPHVFQQLREAMPQEGRLPLTLNFRSQPGILDFVNALFCDALGPDYEPLKASKPQLSPQPIVEFMWATSEEDPDASQDKATLRALEADWIARRVRSLLDSQQPIVSCPTPQGKGTWQLRPVRPGDVAVLFRALSDIQHYENAFQRYEIDYYLVGGHAFYSQQEVFDILNVMRAVNNPADQLSLLGALRSPMFGLLDETLFWLAQQPGGLSHALWNQSLPPQLTDQQRRAVEFASATLREMRQIKDRVGIAQLLRLLIDRTGYDAVLLAEFLGQRKLANLHKLLEQARQMDGRGIFSLSDFITELAESVTQMPKEPLAATHGENTDVVRLMTIHQAKGLEFPVVVVADLNRKNNPSKDRAVFSPEIGPAVKYQENLERVVTGLELYLKVQQREDEAESIRLLYVATTRAADYLILSSSLGGKGGKSSWIKLLEDRFDLQTGELRASLPKGYPPPRVRVITEAPKVDGSIGSRRRPPDISRIIEKASQKPASLPKDAAVLAAPLGPTYSLARQFSLSRLTGQLHPVQTRQFEDQPSPPPGEYQTADPVWRDAAELGLVVHSVLAEIDYGNPQHVDTLVQRHAARLLSEPDDRLGEIVDMIERFLGSSRAAAIASASQVYREIEFLLAWPPGKQGGLSAEPSYRRQRPPTGIDGNLACRPSERIDQPQPPIYLQGYIDCLYKDQQQRWHLVDLKTNKVAPGKLDEFVAHYELQLLGYGLAVEAILGQSLHDLTLYFLRPAVERQVHWDAQTRRRAVELLDEALARQMAS